MKFRADIEGLRAVAVLLVVAYHYVPGLLPGGYVGVDVFFVISGYLITLSLLDVRARAGTGRQGLALFWARRARRLLPNALLVLAMVSVLALVLLSDVALRRLGSDVAWASAYSINWLFVARSVDYLRWGETHSSVLLHYWSLAVEEQFYLAWPLLLFVALRGARTSDKSLRHASWLAAVLAALALGYCLWLSNGQLTLGFFSAPARAWELLAGAWLALRSHQGEPALRWEGARSAHAVAWVGLAAIVGAACLFSIDTTHPGLLTVVPVLGAMLLVASTPVGAEVAVRRWLGSAPMRYLGARSYSLYLWHWPVLVLGQAALPTGEPWAVLLLVALSFLLADAAYRLVETPARFRWAQGANARQVLLMALAGSAALVLVGLATRELAERGARGRLRPAAAVAAPALPPLRRLLNDLPSVYAKGCHLGVEPTEPAPHCRFGSGATAVLLFGDSHAAQWLPPLEVVTAAQGQALVAWTKSGCPSADVSVWNAAARGPYHACDRWREAVFHRLATLKPSLVVVANLIEDATVLIDRRSGERLRGAAAEAEFQAGLVRTLQRLRASGTMVVVIRDTPRPRGDVIECLYASPDPRRCERTRRDATAAAPLDVRAASVAGVPLWDFADNICRAESCPVYLPSQALVVYRDDNHLSASFARSLAPALAQRWPSLPTQGR